MPSCSSLLVASAKGGVGKSTTALGLAAAFARSGKRVLLVDLDITSRSLDMLTGASDLTVRDLADLLETEGIPSVPADVCSHPVEDCPSLSFVAAPTAEHLARLSAADEKHRTPELLLREAVIRLYETVDFDMLVCDTGGGCSIPAAVADLFDLTVITSEQSLTSVRAAEYTASLLDNAGASHLRLVICGFDLSSVKKENRAGVIEMIDRCSVPCAGVVPYDRTLQKAQDNGILPEENALSSAAYRNIAARILGTEVPLFAGMGWLYRKRALAL